MPDICSGKELNLTFTRGDTFSFSCQYVSNCKDVDITHAQIIMIAKSDAAIPDEDAYFIISNATDAIVVIDGLLGTMQITIPEIATIGCTWQHCYYQMKIFLPSTLNSEGETIPDIRDTVLYGVINLRNNLLLATTASSEM